MDNYLTLFAEGRTVVRRAVINKDDFEIGVCLVNDRGNTFVQIFLDVIDGNDDANQWMLIILHSL